MNNTIRITLAVTGPLIAALGFIPYLKNTIKGNVRPRIATWSSWSLITAIATVAAISEQAYVSAFLTGIATAIELSILFMAIRKGGYGYGWADGICQAISIIGVVAWIATNNAIWAIIFNIIADFFGAVPTFYHTWIDPYDEDWRPFIISGFGSVISLLAVSSVGFTTAGFPIYLSVIGFALGVNIYLSQKLSHKK